MNRTTEAPPPPRRSRLQSFRIADTLASELRQRILRGKYDGDGSLPKQEQLVDEFGVSFPSVREALRILEAEGLIVVRRGNLGGALIHRPDAVSAGYAVGLALEAGRVRLRDLAESLLVFEPLCTAICAKRKDRKRSVVPRLRENIANTEKVIDDEVEFHETARAFHGLIVSSVDNDSISLTVRSLVALWTSQEETWEEALATRGEHFQTKEREEALHYHVTLTDMIEAGDADGAEALGRRHLAAMQSVLVKRFGDEIIDAHSGKAIAAMRGAHMRS